MCLHFYIYFLGLGTWEIVGIIAFLKNNHSFLVNTHRLSLFFSLHVHLKAELTYLGFLRHPSVNTDYSYNLLGTFQNSCVFAEAKPLWSLSTVRTSTVGMNPFSLRLVTQKPHCFYHRTPFLCINLISSYTFYCPHNYLATVHIIFLIEWRTKFWTSFFLLWLCCHLLL